MCLTKRGFISYFHWMLLINTRCLEMQQFGDIPERLTEFRRHLLRTLPLEFPNHSFYVCGAGGVGAGGRKLAFKLLARLRFYYSSEIILSVKKNMGGLGATASHFTTPESPRMTLSRTELTKQSPAALSGPPSPSTPAFFRCVNQHIVRFPKSGLSFSYNLLH